MNWIERLYEIKGKDLYSQNGEGLILEHIFELLKISKPQFVDIGGGDGVYLSNTRHLSNLGSPGVILDRENGVNVTRDNLFQCIVDQLGSLSMFFGKFELVSVDIDGNDYWILEWFLTKNKPAVIIAEFNAAFTDSRTIKYDPDHVWAGDDYYGFSFEAGVKLAERFGYKVIFQVADMNMIMVRADLLDPDMFIPPVTFKQNDFFKKSNRTEPLNWVTI